MKGQPLPDTWEDAMDKNFEVITMAVKKKNDKKKHNLEVSFKSVCGSITIKF